MSCHPSRPALRFCPASVQGRSYTQTLGIRRRPSPAPSKPEQSEAKGSSMQGLGACLSAVPPPANIRGLGRGGIGPVSDTAGVGGEAGGGVYAAARLVTPTSAGVGEVAGESVARGALGEAQAQGAQGQAGAQAKGRCAEHETVGVGWGEESLSVAAAASGLASFALDDEEARRGGSGRGGKGWGSSMQRGEVMSVEAAPVGAGAGDSSGAGAAAGAGVDGVNLDDGCSPREATAMSLGSEEEPCGVAWVDGGREELLSVMHSCESVSFDVVSLSRGVIRTCRGQRAKEVGAGSSSRSELSLIVCQYSANSESR